ncbi:MAG: 3',5'-cyclic-nucleotide phosphodiesterase [Proteobacteria bacterium]|nr:3',5'-cyclic-nucleotide phosphodiesterase [Pseudomonadota bacterium]
MKKFKYICLLALFYVNAIWAATPIFQIVPLGTSGGEFEDNLSSYLIRAFPTNAFVALDAGTLCSSINKIPEKTIEQLSGQPVTREVFFKENIKAYLISHDHLDHISGLVLCSTMDTKKELIGIPSTIKFLTENIFNWKIWPNFADQGTAPTLKQYHYHILNFNQNYSIPQTGITVRAFPLSHGPGYQSTAFLLESKGQYLLYLGDTGADVLEKSHDLQLLWQSIAPLIKSKKLRAIAIESSYTNAQPDNKLFGHLNPHWLLNELRVLAKTVDPKHPELALKDLPVLVTHIKQGLEKENNAKIIMHQLNDQNDLGVQFILPKSGNIINF